MVSWNGSHDNTDYGNDSSIYIRWIYNFQKIFAVLTGIMLLSEVLIVYLKGTTYNLQA